MPETSSPIPITKADIRIVIDNALAEIRTKLDRIEKKIDALEKKNASAKN